MYFLINELSEKYMAEDKSKIFFSDQIIKKKSLSEISGYYLFFNNNKLSIANTNEPGVKPVSVDFESKQNLNRLKRDPRQSELLYKAIKGKQSIVSAVDGTAGMGIDSMLLARLGFKVTAFEKNFWVYLILKDGLRRGRESECEPIRVASNNIELIFQDVSELNKNYDLIYLDFMFDGKDKKTKSKKNMELFKSIVELSTYEDQNIILSNAVRASPKKVVIKRPLKADIFKIKAYSHSILGKSVRFDIYLPNK